MNHNKETFHTWNKIAKIYEDKFMKMDLYNETYDFVCDTLKKENSKILEIGCGPGNITNYLLSTRPDLKIHGIDIAPNMIALAEKNNPTASFTVMDAREIASFDTKFDGIIAGFCIPYFSSSETAQFILDAKHLLNKGGMIYISFAEGTPSLSNFKNNSYGDKVYFYYHELETLKTLLNTNEFDAINVFKVDFKKSSTETDVHTVLIARKN